MGAHSSALRVYEATLAACDALDYFDLVAGARRLLVGSAPAELAAGAAIRARYSTFFVDEFQDSTPPQMDLLTALCPTGRITVVGDADQSIFSFAGALPDAFGAFAAAFPGAPCAAFVACDRSRAPGASTLSLPHNFRCSGAIVSAACALLRANHAPLDPPRAIAVHPGGPPLRVVECRTSASEAAFVCDAVASLPRGPNGRWDLSKTAVLYRVGAVGECVAAALKARGVPFNAHAVPAYSRKGGKALLALLRAAAKEEDAVSGAKAFAALYPGDKAAAKHVAAVVTKRAAAGVLLDAPRTSGAPPPPTTLTFLGAARLIFGAKLSGVLSKIELACGRKALATLELVSRLSGREPSLSALITAAAGLLPRQLLQAGGGGGGGGSGGGGGGSGGGGGGGESGEAGSRSGAESRSLLDTLLDDASEFLRDQQALEHADFAGDQGAAAALPPMIQPGCRESLAKFLDHLASEEKEGAKERRALDAGALTLTTMHGSKGLEWNTVFIVGCTDGCIPLLGSRPATPTELAEERRLFFVAITRAKSRVVISYAALSGANGRGMGRQRSSRFLDEIPGLEWQQQTPQQAGGGAAAPPQPPLPQPPNCAVGASKDIDLDALCDGAFDSQPAAGPAHAGPAAVDAFVAPLEEAEEGYGDALVPQSIFLQTNFKMSERSFVARIFHNEAKFAAFQEAGRLLGKVAFDIHRLRQAKSCTGAQALVLDRLKGLLHSDECREFAASCIQQALLPADERAIAAAARAERYAQAGGEAKSA